jgi:hypothetical protein
MPAERLRALSGSAAERRAGASGNGWTNAKISATTQRDG